MPDSIPFIRIFVSSPGDVNDERKIALDVIEQLPYRPSFRDKVAFRVIAWDKPGAGVPMRATLTPQDAINKGLPTPAECDIVIVIFWSRMGTPFVHTDSVEYPSGTYWELLNALESDRAETVIYRRTEVPIIPLSDPKYDETVQQYRKVQAFFESDLFYDADGKIKRGINVYETPDDFRKAFEIALEVLVLDILNRAGKTPVDSVPDSENVKTIEPDVWDQNKSPFPGLRAFTKEDAPIFFGRGYETDKLIKQVASSRFVAVVGASGSGKSSLVGAGLIPRLEGNAITGSKDWKIVQFTPGENPLDNLYDALLEVFPHFQPNPMEARRIRQNFIADMREAPGTLLDICTAGLKDAPEWVDVLLFVDQFEELFTLASKADVQVFAEMLDAIAKSECVRVVITMRADFYHRAVEFPQLAELLRAGSFPLAIPKRDALRQMIERPAERAGIVFDAALVDRILDDTGDEPGNLALMAYALDELYKLDDDKHLTHEEYDALGGVQGAIGTRAENEFIALGGDENVLQQVFHALVEVDERGTATRRREQFKPDAVPETVRDLIYGFTTARLLTTSYDDSTKTATVEVAHEAILRSWERLAEWIEDTQDDLRLLRQVRNAAEEWYEKGRPDFLLWQQERLAMVYAMQDRLIPEISVVERDFIEPENARLLRELDNLPQDATSHERRRDIGDRLAVIGDPREGVGVKDGVPDMVWLPVDGGGEISIEYGGSRFSRFGGGNQEKKTATFQVPPFFIAKYLVTYAQYQAFGETEDGFNNVEWWRDFPSNYQPQALSGALSKLVNSPRDSVSWYQSVAFGRWMTHRWQGLELLHPSGTILRVGENAEIRLPLEWEWQWAAQGGHEVRQYPWGDWREGYANTSEAGLSRTTAVGMYPHSMATCGAVDMAGNLFEWCQNDDGDPQIVNGYDNGKSKELRGGSFDRNQDTVASSYRDNLNPFSDNFDFGGYVGLRLVISTPIDSLLSLALGGEVTPT